MGIKEEDWDLDLHLTQYSYNTMPRPIFEGMPSYEVLHGFRPTESVRFSG